MKKLLVCIAITIGMMTANLTYSAEKHQVSSKLKNVDQVKLESTSKGYKLSFINLLNENEVIYKNNIIMFMIDNEPMLLRFALFIKMSNAGVEEEAVLIVPRSLLVKIVNSKTTAVKLGGNRTTMIDDSYKDLMIGLLEKTKQEG